VNALYQAYQIQYSYRIKDVTLNGSLTQTNANEKENTKQTIYWCIPLPTHCNIIPPKSATETYQQRSAYSLQTHQPTIQIDPYFNHTKVCTRSDKLSVIPSSIAQLEATVQSLSIAIIEYTQSYILADQIRVIPNKTNLSS
jgi:hypothetical protein